MEPADKPDLLAELLDRLDDEGDAALDRLCDEHPEDAPALRRKYERLREMGLLEKTSAGDTSGARGIALPERLGDFRLKQMLGGGGMGVVYLAEQDGLGREVALKLIRPENLFFPGMRDRFQREVETIARMQHPGIVPIYTVGIDGDIPYFAMERVVGANLGEVIDQLREGSEGRRSPDTLTGADLGAAVAKAAGIDAEAGDAYLFAGTYEQTCVRMIRHAADALDHAHRRGVLHRDIKPSNIMVTPDGRVLLLDFGLATSEGSHRLTRTGSQMGSIHYSSPEQTRGEFDRVDARSDIYSLGITLYELLTLSHAFDGDSIHQIQSAIARGLSTPPRRVNGSVSWETETVCLTAVELDPRRRYQTAGDLARDCQNILDHRPIEARRVGVARRAVRLAQRHPAIAVAIVLAAVSLIGYALLQRQAVSAIRVERDRARKNLDQLLQTIDDMLIRVASERLQNTPMVSGLRRELALLALASLDELLVDEAERPEVIEQAARAYASAGEVHAALSENDIAERHFERVAELVDQLGDDASLKVRIVAARALERRGWILNQRGEPEEADALFEASRIAFQVLADEAGDNPDIASGLADAHRDRGNRATDSSRFDDAAREFERSIAYTEAALAHDPDHQRLNTQRLLTSLNFARALLFLDPDRSVAVYAEAADRAAELCERYPDDLELQRLRAVSRTYVGLTFVQLGRAADAEPELARGIEEWRRLIEEYPERPMFRMNLASSHLGLGEMLHQIGRHDDALPPLHEARRHLARLCEDYRDNVVYLQQLAAAEGDLGDVLLTLDRLAEADESFAGATQTLDRLLEIHPDDGQTHAQIGLNLDGRAAVALAGGGDVAARAHLERAIDHYARALALHDGDPRVIEWYATAWQQLMGLLLGQRDDAAASELVAASRDLITGDLNVAALSAQALLECVAIVDEGPTDDASAERRERYLRGAVEALTAAKEGGLAGIDEFLRSDLCAPLAGRPEFEALLDDGA